MQQKIEYISKEKKELLEKSLSLELSLDKKKTSLHDTSQQLKKCQDQLAISKEKSMGDQEIIRFYQNRNSPLFSQFTDRNLMVIEKQLLNLVENIRYSKVVRRFQSQMSLEKISNEHLDLQSLLSHPSTFVQNTDDLEMNFDSLNIQNKFFNLPPAPHKRHAGL